MTLLRDTKLQWIKINEPRRKLISVSILVHRRFDRLRHDMSTRKSSRWTQKYQLYKSLRDVCTDDINTSSSRTVSWRIGD